MVERNNLESVMREKDLDASGRLRPDTAAQIGQLTGAEYIVLGTVTSYSEDTKRSGGGLNIGGISIGGRSASIGIGGSKSEAYVAVDLRVVNANTGVSLRARRGWIGGNLSQEG